MKGTFVERPKVPRSIEDRKKKKASKDQPRVPNQMPPTAGMPPAPMVQGFVSGVFAPHPAMIRKYP